MNIHKNIDRAFTKTMNVLAEKFNSIGKDNALYLTFQKKNPQLYFFSKGEKPQPMCFSQMVSLPMIGMGFTVEKVYLSFNSLIRSVQKQFKLSEDNLSLLLFSNKNNGVAVVGLCVNEKHKTSYYLSEVLQVFNSKYEQLN